MLHAAHQGATVDELLFCPSERTPGARPAPKARPRKEIIVTRNPPPARTLSERPNLDQLKRQAKELLDAFRAGEPGADAGTTQILGVVMTPDARAYAYTFVRAISALFLVDGLR
jgi:hypothetical protein